MDVNPLFKPLIYRPFVYLTFGQVYGWWWTLNHCRRACIRKELGVLKLPFFALLAADEWRQIWTDLQEGHWSGLRYFHATPAPPHSSGRSAHLRVLISGWPCGVRDGPRSGTGPIFPSRRRFTHRCTCDRDSVIT